MNDPVQLLETVYSLGETEQQWLQRIAERMKGHFSRMPAVLANTYDVTSTDEVRVRAVAMCNIDSALLARRDEVALPRAEDMFVAPILRRGFVGGFRRSPSALRRAGLAEERVRQYERQMDSFLRSLKLADQVWINAQDPTYLGVCFMLPADRNRLSPQEVHHWRCVAAHVSAAFRIRRQLETAGAALDSSSAEAILRPNGRVEHATMPAQSGAARAALRRAVLGLDAARGPMGREAPEKAIALWQALVAGRWSLLDHFDSDGRHYVVAHRNDAGVSDLRGLTAREAQVVAHAALGHSNKMIAYSLGLSLSTIGEHLASARKKLQALSAGASEAKERKERGASNA